MLYYYAVIALDEKGQEIPGTEHYATSITEYKPGEIADAGCSQLVKVQYEV